MEQKYISVKDFYEIMNKDHPGLIGINKIYKLVKHKDFPSCHLGGRYVILYPEAANWFSTHIKSRKRL